MKSLPSMNIRHKCPQCDLRAEDFYCNVSDPILQAFYLLKITNVYRKGATLFTEGEPSNGVYMLCQGQVKLSTYSKDGKALILRIAGPGELLGLGALLSASGHEATAEVIESCQINCVARTDFLRFLREHADAGVNALKQLSRIYHAAYTQVCSLGLSATVSDKLIKLLLSWSKNTNGNNGGVRLKLTFSHEEIAEMIGTSRESVTRMLKELRERELIVINGVDLIISDLRKLEEAIGTRLQRRQHA